MFESAAGEPLLRITDKKSKRGTPYRTDLRPSFATDQSRASPDERLDPVVVPTQRRGSRAKSRSVLRDGVASSLNVATHLVGKGGHHGRARVRDICTSVCTMRLFTRVRTYRGCCPIGCRSYLSPLTVAMLVGITGRSSTRSTCLQEKAAGQGVGDA